VTGQLRAVSDDGPAPCSICGALAVGPCATCRSPVCGDCCVLTEGGARTWAICLRCERRGGRSLRGGWTLVAAWLVVPLVVLAAIVAAIEIAAGS
jgi:hypothetical protein